MSVKGQKVIAKNNIENRIEKGKEYIITSAAKNHCVLDNKILLSTSDLKMNFEPCHHKKPDNAITH